MFENISDIWLVVGVIVICGGIFTRWLYAKSKGTKIEDGPEIQVFSMIRTSLVSLFSNTLELRALEKDKGREAVRIYITSEIRRFINSTDTLTEAEKALITSLDITYLVRIVENHLVSINVLQKEKH